MLDIAQAMPPLFVLPKKIFSWNELLALGIFAGQRCEANACLYPSRLEFLNPLFADAKPESFTVGITACTQHLSLLSRWQKREAGSAARIVVVWGARKMYWAPPCRATRGSYCQGVGRKHFPSAEYKRKACCCPKQFYQNPNERIDYFWTWPKWKRDTTARTAVRNHQSGWANAATATNGIPTSKNWSKKRRQAQAKTSTPLAARKGQCS